MIALLLALVLSVQAADRGTALERVPAAARALANPYHGSGDARLAGRKLYQRHCAQCHEGADRGKAPSLTRARLGGMTAGGLFWFLKNGNLKEGMPAWSRVPEQRLWQIVTYLQSDRTD